MLADYRDIAVELKGPVARVSHNRPQARNAEGQQLLDELDDALASIANDDAIRVVIIAGKGEHFSAGHDLKEAQANRANFSVEQRWEYELTRYYEYSLRIRDYQKPTIAQVQGACIAGAFIIANMCDLVIASEDAFFSDPVCQSMAVASVEVLVHPWVMGGRRAKEMLFTGEPIRAAEAKAIGMVNRVVPKEMLESETWALAEKIAAAPPFAIQLLKRSINRTQDAQGMKVALSAHFDTHQLSHVTDEFRANGKNAFSAALEKGKASQSKR